MSINLEDYVATIPDFPAKGILFRDVTPMIKDPAAYRTAVDDLAAYCRSRGAEVIVGPESRGFLFGCPVAYALQIGFVPVRKPGKLPRETVSCKYELEYGTNELFMHKDAIQPGQKVVVIDDLLATGGTANAAANMIEQLGGEVVGMAFVIELSGLPGREELGKYDVHSIMVLPDKAD